MEMIDFGDVQPPEFCSNQGCWTRLLYFSGDRGLPDGLYCPNCNDILYDFDGNEVATLRDDYEKED